MFPVIAETCRIWLPVFGGIQGPTRVAARLNVLWIRTNYGRLT